MWNVDPGKIKCASWIYICPLCTADSRGPAAGAEERDLSQLPKFILINGECITPAICTHLVTSAGLAAAQGGFTYSWANPSLLHPCWNFRSLTPVQLLPLPRTSFVSTRPHPKALLSNPETHKKLCCFLSSFSSSFTTFSSVFIDTHILPRLLSWGCKCTSVWTILGTNIKTSHSSHCLYPNLTVPYFCKGSVLFTDWIKIKNPDMHVLFLLTNKGDSKCNNLAAQFGASNSTLALFNTILIHQNR